MGTGCMSAEKQKTECGILTLLGLIITVVHVIISDIIVLVFCENI